ncbi:MAG TPA: hypothetical protein VGK73_14775 [Polyangiaceae bacterium]
MRYTEEHPDEADDLDLPEWPTELLQFVEATSPENVAALLESASFAERAAAFLREHGKAALESLEIHAVGETLALRTALAELLRSLPAQPAKEKPDAP